MNICEPSNSFNCNSFNTRLKNDDWRPCQQLLLTRFVPVQCSNMFQTINQDYGSFYHNQRVSLCQPDVLKEKAYRQQERFANSFLTRMCPRTLSDKSGNSLFSQQNIETMNWCGNNNPSRLCADSCYPVTPPSSGLFLLTNPVFDC
ncbi:unnamed protein product [Adineta ricciae]|uniref:Uncharacterized protein n=1 Tax=Adineta ricciae TaxID=249248 RepID=A0A814G5B0_ADIRI|nr:unnamed protein product [Adineta ricciae]